MKNGQKLVLMCEDKVIDIAQGCTIPIDLNYESKESAEWEELMKKARYWSCELDNTKISIMTYYYHRGNKYFFRNSGAKIVMEVDEFPIALKYGTEVTMKFETK